MSGRMGQLFLQTSINSSVNPSLLIFHLSDRQVAGQ